MRVDNLSGLDDDGNVPGIRFDQGLDGHSKREQGGDGGMLRVNAAVCENDEPWFCLVRRKQFAAQCLEHRTGTLGALTRKESQIDAPDGKLLL